MSDDRKLSPEFKQAYDLGRCEGKIEAMSAEIARLRERVKALEDKQAALNSAAPNSG